MTYVEKIEDEKLREHARDSKRAWVEDGGFSHQRLGSGRDSNRSWVKDGGFSHQRSGNGGHGKFYSHQKQVG